MKYLIDIGHPAHVHYFRNLARILIDAGHSVLFTARSKEVAIQLLIYYKFDFISFGRPFKSRIGKILGLVFFTFRLLNVAVKFKPDLYINATPYCAIVAWLMRKPHISLEDTFNHEQIRLYLPFTSAVLTGVYPHPDLGKKEIRYHGYHELAYLHPNRFKPDPQALKYLGLKEFDKIVILRFISWNASHDFGSSGMSIRQKEALVNSLERYAKVFISSEKELPEKLQKYKLCIPPEKIHDVLAFALLYIGEGATMASECAMLGTPAIFVNPQDVYTVLEQEKRYGLVFNFKNFDGVMEKALDIVITPGLKDEFHERMKEMLLENIDLTAFLLWFVAFYPHSFCALKENSSYSKRYIGND